MIKKLINTIKKSVFTDFSKFCGILIIVSSFIIATHAIAKITVDNVTQAAIDYE